MSPRSARCRSIRSSLLHDVAEEGTEFLALVVEREPSVFLEFVVKKFQFFVNESPPGCAGAFLVTVCR